MLSDDLGVLLVRIAREAVERRVRGGEASIPNLPPELLEQRGAFVTLLKLIEGEPTRRGCIGYPLPQRPLAEAVMNAAVAACHDPRFPPVEVDELERLLVEVSVLTPPQRIQAKNPLAYTSHVKVGEDGLIVEWRGYQGLLLPQVAVEEKWDAEDFLCGICVKAGAPPDCWLNGAILYKFQSEVFREEGPRGPVKRLTSPGI